VRLKLEFRDIRVPEAELRSLHMWLMADPIARRHANPTLGASRSLPPGAQGGTVDLVSLVVSSGFNAASLALSLVSWRATRPQRPTVTVDRPDGVTITISDSSVEEARRLIESLLDGSTGTSEPDEVDGSGGRDGFSA
jgi:membrane-associated two-gene conflict system component 1 (EACC1)